MDRPRTKTGEPDRAPARIDGVTEADGRVKAALVDADSLEVVWANQAAAASAVNGRLDVSFLVPEDGGHTAAEIIAEVSRTGAPAAIGGEIGSNARGSLMMLTTVNPVPGGMLLVLSESTWVISRQARDSESGPRNPRARGRR